MKDCRKCTHCHRLPPRWWETCEIHNIIIKDCERQAAGCSQYQERELLKDEASHGARTSVDKAPSVSPEQMPEAPKVQGAESTAQGVQEVYQALPRAAQSGGRYHFVWNTDYIELADIANVFFSQLDTALYPEEQLKEQYENLLSDIQSGDYHFCMMYELNAHGDPKAMGLALMNDLEYPGVFYIDWLVARERHRGLGRQLLSACVLRAIQLKASKLWTVTRPENAGAYKLLASHGFTKIGTFRKHWYGYDYMIYERILKG